MANIKLDLPGTPFTGQIVTFTAPCDCANVTNGLIIGGETYKVVDALGAVVTGTSGAWVSGAQVSVLLDTAKKFAYIQNSAKPGNHTHAGVASVYTATIGTNWTEDSNTGVKTQTVTISGITANNTAKVDHYFNKSATSEGYASFVEEENQFLECITNGYAETVANGIKFTIFGDANTVSIPIVVEVV